MDQGQAIRDSGFPASPAEVAGYIEKLKREQCERVLLALAMLSKVGELEIKVRHQPIGVSPGAAPVAGVRVVIRVTAEEDELVFEGKSTNADPVVGMIDALTNAIPIIGW